MFKITDNPVFTHIVKVKVPVDGGHKVETFKATFRALPVSEMKGFDLETGEGTRDFLVKAVVGVDDIADDKGEPMPFCDEVRDRLLDAAFIRQALVETYFAAIAPARAKNS